MVDYAPLTSVFEVAIPQVWRAKYPDHPFTRTVQVSDEAEDNFLITQAKVLISPKSITQRIDIFQYCTRVCSACWDFDHKKEQAAKRLHEDFQSQLTRICGEIEKRWGAGELASMIDLAFNTTTSTNGKHDD